MKNLMDLRLEEYNMIIKMLVEGGEMKPGPTVGQQLGPIGINIGDVISKVNQATISFKGMKVPIILDINPKTKELKIEVSSPQTSELLKKELGLEKAAGDHKKETVANASIEQIIKVAQIKHPNMLAKDFKSAVKTVVGSCLSLGILIENKPAGQIENEIKSGKFDNEILEQKTETSKEKAVKLKEFFDQIHQKQEAAKKVEEEAKAAEEAAKAAETAKPAEGQEEKPGEEKAAETAKPAEEAKPGSK